MPGTLVRDNLAPNLATGATLTAAATVTGTVVQLDKPGEIDFELLLGTVSSTSNTATLSVELKGADNSAFDSGVVSFGRFAAITGNDSVQTALAARYLHARVDKKYVRATLVIGGTSPSYANVTIKPVMPNLDRIAATRTA